MLPEILDGEGAELVELIKTEAVVTDMSYLKVLINFWLSCSSDLFIFTTMIRIL